MIKILKLSVFLLFFTGCGFEIVDRSSVNFDIIEIKTEGDKKINYRIKNKLLANTDKNNLEKIMLELKTNKTKIVKERNTKNEITKYQVKITTNVKYNKITDNKFINFSLYKSGDFEVASQYSQTLTNEKKLTNSLVGELIDEIFDRLIFSINDL